MVVAETWAEQAIVLTSTLHRQSVRLGRVLLNTSVSSGVDRDSGTRHGY